MALNFTQITTPMRWLKGRCVRQLRMVATTRARHSYLELAREVDSFPSRQHDPKAYAATIANYYKFKLSDLLGTYGLLSKVTAEQFQWPSYWNIDHSNQNLTLAAGSNIRNRSDCFNETLRLIAESKTVPSITKLRNETIPLYGPNGQAIMHIDRAGSILFGTIMRGIQLLAYTIDPKTGQILYWVPWRSASVRAYAGMLDHCAGGALNSGETPMETLVREAREEASLPEDYVRENARSFGVLSYHMNHNANNEPGHQPQVMYTYSLALPEGMEPKPGDGEVERFELMNLEEVEGALWDRRFKANCVLTWLSYFISNGILDAENESNLQQITTHLHRRLEFPN